MWPVISHEFDTPSLEESRTTTSRISRLVISPTFGHRERPKNRTVDNPPNIDVKWTTRCLNVHATSRNTTVAKAAISIDFQCGMRDAMHFLYSNLVHQTLYALWSIAQCGNVFEQNRTLNGKRALGVRFNITENRLTR
ncbi:hypothetical protein TNCV_1126011 [Trichonephila clavipes]|nr:hypothetical protein TNCV_1126011 [Trichonephila clavipes]